MLSCLIGLRENRRHPATYLVHGAKALNNAFRGWTRKEVGVLFFHWPSMIHFWLFQSFGLLVRLNVDETSIRLIIPASVYDWLKPHTDTNMGNTLPFNEGGVFTEYGRCKAYFFCQQRMILRYHRWEKNLSIPFLLPFTGTTLFQS